MVLNLVASLSGVFRLELRQSVSQAVFTQVGNMASKVRELDRVLWKLVGGSVYAKLKRLREGTRPAEKSICRIWDL
jgi:hypothetical protein